MKIPMVRTFQLNFQLVHNADQTTGNAVETRDKVHGARVQKSKPARKGQKKTVSVKNDHVKEELDDSDHADWDELPHGLGKQKIKKHDEDEDGMENDFKNGEDVDETTKLPKEEDSMLRSEVKLPDKPKPGKHPYGLTPGTSPYPNYKSPSAEQCEEVHRLLSTMHGPKLRSKNPPRASATVTGCGAVPFVLDAVLRTLLSASTTAKNSATALKGLISTFGSIDDSPDWDAVRRATLPQVVDSIKRAGLANMKGKNIKAILDTVYNRNMQDAKSSSAPAVKSEDNDKKDVKGQSPMLRMAYVDKMSDEEAMTELTLLPGIGVKTAACVLLFNMGRDVFAVDTHVFRLTQWLGWLPPDVKGVTRDKTFSHLEVHIPAHLKYPLHAQFVTHGRECLRCRANTSPNTDGWDEAVCPIEDLVHRTGAMKQGKRKSGKENGKKAVAGRVTKKKGSTTGKKRKADYEDSEESESEVEMEATEPEEESESDVEMDDD